MFLRQTTNYQLPSWDSEDRILRTDFNDLTEKVDTALAGKLGRSQLLQSFVTEKTSNVVDIDTSDMDWDQWETVTITFEYGRPMGDSVTGVYRVHLNGGQTSASCSTKSGLFAYTGANPFLLTLLPRHDSSRTVQGIYLGTDSGLGIGQCTFAELSSLRLEYYKDGSTMGPGGKVEVWGVA